MPRSTILFDLDGTLVDSAHDIAGALTRLSLSRGGGKVGVETVRPLISLGASVLVARALGPAAGDREEDLAAFRTILRETPSDPEAVFSGVEEALDTLARWGCRLAVVTNKPYTLAAALLEAHQLGKFFSALVGGDTAARPKPDPASLRHALSLLGAAPEDALFVGDSGVDAKAAASLGIPLLIYSGGYGAHEVSPGEVTASFSNFADLPAVVAAHRQDHTPCATAASDQSAT